MYFLAHMGLAVLAMSILSLTFTYGIFGSLLADLIDKPLHFLGFAPSGRFIGHTLFASLVAFSFTYFATKDRKKSAALFVGYLSHFLADLCQPFLPLFYPFISYRFPVYPFGLRYTLFFFLTDLAGILIMVFIYFRNERFRAEVKGLMRRISGYFLVHFL